MLSLDHPAIDWVSVARGFGVEARRVATVREFAEAFREGLRPGPFLIEAVLDA
jgi:acetolactate synthase-1/2/3 large subunit